MRAYDDRAPRADAYEAELNAKRVYDDDYIAQKVAERRAAERDEIAAEAKVAWDQSGREIEGLRKKAAKADADAEAAIDGSQFMARVASIKTKLATRAPRPGRPDLTVVADALERAVEAEDVVGIRAARIVGPISWPTPVAPADRRPTSPGHLANRMQVAEQLERGEAPRTEAQLRQAERERRELEFASRNTEPRVTGRESDMFSGGWSESILGRTISDQGGGVVMPERVEPVSAA